MNLDPEAEPDAARDPERVFVVWDPSIDGMRNILAALRNDPPAGFIVDARGLNHGVGAFRPGGARDRSPERVPTRCWYPAGRSARSAEGPQRRQEVVAVGSRPRPEERGDTGGVSARRGSKQRLAAACDRQRGEELVCLARFGQRFDVDEQELAIQQAAGDRKPLAGADQPRGGRSATCVRER